MMTHKDLEIWKLGIEVVEKVYQITAGYPKIERFYALTHIRIHSLTH